jgi:glycosyltransferase involved in cell wall biosynthesis
MILRDRNHPSVIMWCMGNESRNRKAYLELRSIARNLDPDRPVTYAENHLYRARREKTIGIPDVWGSNYELDVLEDGAAASALNCVVVTECSNYPDAVPGNTVEELRQVEIIETDLKRLEGRPCVAGFALWCFNDYATMRKKRYRRFSGIVDAWRSPKMSCALLRAMFLKEPFIRVVANWAEDPAASAHSSAARRTIHVFTNCGKVVLKIDGQPVATLSGGPHIATALEFTAGELSAEGSLAGKIVSDSIVSSGGSPRVSVAGAHVAHLNTGKEWGGGENQVFNLVRHLVEAGSRNTIFAPQGGELFLRAAAAGLSTKSMPAGAWLSRFPPGYMRLAQACRESGVDIIHAHDSHALDAGIAVSRQLGIPLVYTRRVASPLRQNPLSRRKYSSRNISAVIAISETVKDVFLKSGYPAERVHVVPTAIDADRLSRTQADPDLRSTYNSDYLVGGLGKLSRKKNWQFLIKVAAFMKDRKPDIQWLIAGEGPERRNLERLARDAGVSSRVHLLGTRMNAVSILKTLDILFSPSVAEGAGVTIRESMVLGTPVVAVDAPGSMESLAGHGWSVKNGDIEGAARAITEILSDKSRTKTVCEEARASAARRFSFDGAVEGALEVYRSVSKR